MTTFHRARPFRSDKFYAAAFKTRWFNIMRHALSRIVSHTSIYRITVRTSTAPGSLDHRSTEAETRRLVVPLPAMILIGVTRKISRARASWERKKINSPYPHRARRFHTLKPIAVGLVVRPSISSFIEIAVPERYIYIKFNRLQNLTLQKFLRDIPVPELLGDCIKKKKTMW